MIEETDVQELVEDAVERPQPGHRLREAREAKGLSREEVATQLRLQVRLIEALEEGDETVLPPSTFVNGYLRSYARLLDIPEDSVIPTSGRGNEPKLVATIANKGEASSRDWPARLVTYFVVIAIAVSVAMWWLSQRDGNGVESTLSESAVEPEVIEQGDSVSLALPGSDAETLDGDSVGTEEVAEESASTPDEGSDTSVPEAVPREETALEAASSEPKVSSPGGPPALTATTPQAKLELRYEADSWTEVTDSAGRQLSYGLVKAGEVLVLRGEAPFRVFLGYASGVNVYYNDDLFDHSPFQRRDVARFRIGRAEHNHPGSR